jgi:hypothetical protein
MNMITAVARPLSAAERPPLPPPQFPTADTAAASGDALSKTEQATLLASLADDRASVATTTSGRPLVRVLFGFPPPVRLAGARLEALRRYAVLYRLEGAALPPEEDSRLRKAGFSDRQVEAARGLIDARFQYEAAGTRAGGKTITAALLATGATAAFLIDRWLAHQVDDTLSAHIMTIMLVTWLVSMGAITSHPHSRRA